MKKIICLLMILQASCATSITKELDTTKPVQTQTGLFNAPLTQDGKNVDYFDAVAKFKEIPETEKIIQKSQFMFWTSVVFAGGAGYFLSSYIWGQNPTHGYVGLASMGLAFVTGAYSTSLLIDAADIYNQRFGWTKPANNAQIIFTPIFGGGAVSASVTF